MLKIFHLTIESHYHSNKIIIGSKAKCALNNLPTMSNRPFKLPQVGNFLQQALIHQHFPKSKEHNLDHFLLSQVPQLTRSGQIGPGQLLLSCEVRPAFVIWKIRPTSA